MRIVVTGREGQVVRALTECGPAQGHEVIALGRPQLDLARDAEAIVAALEAGRPDAIVSAAAYTAVDRAEAEPELAAAVNVGGAAAVARAAKALAVPLIHLSTDYVFDGTKSLPYVEEDLTGPTGVYGETKLAGEQAVLSAHDNVVILRTAWVYSPFGANFVKTMLRLASEREEVAVVADQRGNPTSALDIADAVLQAAANLSASGSASLRGVFHTAGSGDASWADLAETVFAASALAGGPSARVRRIATSDFPTPARRPANSRLDCSRLARVHDIRLPDWRLSAGMVVNRLVAPNRAIQKD
jgi:dTDP-4-dehydrorhamnose reductase